MSGLIGTAADGDALEASPAARHHPRTGRDGAPPGGRVAVAPLVVSTQRRARSAGKTEEDGERPDELDQLGIAEAPEHRAGARPAHGKALFDRALYTGELIER